MFIAKDGTMVGASWAELGIEVPVGRNSGQWKAHCPKCHNTRKNKTDKSLSINLEEQVASCKNIGCEAKYAIDRYANASAFNASTNRIKEKEYKLPAPKVEYNEIDDRTAAWFLNVRHISIETLKKMRVTSGLNYMPQANKELNTIMFNYFDKGVLTNIKYRDGQKNFRMYKDARLIFYNVDALREDNDAIIIVEGEMDALSYIESSVSNVMSVPNGAQLGNNNMEYLNNHYDLFDDKWRQANKLPKLRKIVLAVDTDAAGKALRDEFVRRFGAAKCFFVDYKGCKDANEYLIKFGKTALFNTIDLATPAPLTDVITIDDLWEELGAMHKNGLNPGLQVGTPEFKKHYSFEPARLTIVTGIPTHGKSEFVDDMISRLAVEKNWRFAIFSPENFPIVLHIAKLVSKITGKDFNSCSGLELSEAYAFIRTHFFWIYPADDNYTLKNITRICDSLVERYGVNGLVLDPWTEIDDEGKNDTDGVKNRLTEISRYKRKQNLHIWLVAHPTKMQKDDQGKMIVPDLSNVSGSAHFYNKTDGGITVYRDFEEGTVEVHINKVKFKHLGKIGMVKYSYNVKNGRYETFKNLTDIWDDSNWLNRSEQATLAMPEDEKQIPINKAFDSQRPSDVFIPEENDDLPF